MSSPSNQASSAPRRADERKTLPGLAHEPGPQRETAGLVRAGASGDGSHEVVDLLCAERRPCEAHAQADVLLELPAPSLERAPQELGHAGIAFDPTHLHRVLDPDLGLGRDVGDGGLHDGFLPERGQDLGDVAQEGAARAEHQDPVTAQAGVVVEEEGRTVEPDRGLPRTGATLHGEQLVEGGTDDLVLLGLDGRDDVEHLAGAGPLELGQQGVPTAQAGGAGVRRRR